MRANLASDIIQNICYKLCLATLASQMDLCSTVLAVSAFSLVMSSIPRAIKKSVDQPACRCKAAWLIDVWPEHILV